MRDIGRHLRRVDACWLSLFAPMWGAVSWLRVWWRAVVIPAWRRAAAVWVGAAIVSAVVFGPTGLLPSDVTTLALSRPVVGLVLGVTWLLVVLPTARIVVRADAASFLRSLPSPRGTLLALRAAVLVGLQLPWLALWLAGEGVRGLIVVGAATVPIAVIASWRARPVRTRWPAWRSSGQALRAIYVRALRRRASDAILRGAGLAILAGLTAGLFIRNNDLRGAAAAQVGAAVLAVMLVPAQVGALLVLLDAHRQSRWLAAALGVSQGTRVVAMVLAIGAVHGVAAALAVVSSTLVIGVHAPTLGWLALSCATTAIGAALGAARVMLRAEDSATIAARTVAGAITVAIVIVACLVMFGVPAGLAAILACGGFAVTAVRT